MARKSVLTQINRSLKQAAREIERSNRESQKHQLQAVRRVEVAHKAEQAALKRAQKAYEADIKQLEKEAKLAHIAYKEAQVVALNLEVEQIAEDFDTILESTLDVDDFVDLESLRQVAEHPPFHRPDLESPLPPPFAIELPKEPQLGNPEPSKVGTFLLGKKWSKKKLNREREKHEQLHEIWREEAAKISVEYELSRQERETKELERIKSLETAQQLYRQQCEERESNIAAQNSELDSLITNLGYGTKDAVEEYLSIVLSNSQYPEHFEVGHSYNFDGPHAELALNIFIPNPDSLDIRKGYKYLKMKDETTEYSLSQKAQKDRYLSIVCQVTLRTIHEVFESDRRGIVQTISIQVGTRAPDPATGQEKFLPFSALATSRETFLEFELAHVVPQSTLEHLGAAISKKPFELIAINPKGIRKTK